MLDAPGNRLAEVVDVVLTSRVLRRASNALTLTAAEDEEVERLSRGALRATRFPNGVEFSDSPSLGRDRRSVLFLARLHPRKGAVQFAEAAVGLASHRPDLRFDIVGPDEGDAAAVRAIAERARPGTVVYHGPVDHAAVGAFMDQAALYCLPAHDEPFGLSVLEALAAETPVLLHLSAPVAPEIVAAEAGWVFGNDEQGDDLEEVMGFALADPVELARRGRHARRLVEQRYGIEGVATRLAKVYQGVIAARTGRPGSSQYLRDELNEASS